MMTAQQRIARAEQARQAIRMEHTTAQAVRALWPTDDDQLHSKVERVQQALTRLGKEEAAHHIGAAAHGAAWRKQKRLLVQIHGRTHGKPYEDGDMTQADWWRSATDLAEAAITTALIAEQTILLANKTGPTASTLRLIDAAYWAAKDTTDDLWDAQGDIPPCTEALGLFTRLEIRANRLEVAMDELVTWADANGHTITR